MSKKYKSLNRESHDCSLILQRAYDRGYEQAETDYKKPEISWVPTPCKYGNQFRCTGCGKLAIAIYRYCPNCGCKYGEPENAE